MTAFIIVAAALVLVALLFVLRPLWRVPATPGTTLQSANLTVYRDQFAELERDLKLGTLDSQQYEVARAELQRRLLDEAGAGAGTEKTAVSRGSRGMAIVIAVTIPIVAGLLYWHLGQPQGIGAPKRAAPDASSITPEQFQAMTEKLAQRMAANPDDPNGWLMLGRAYKALQRYPDAIKALAEANRRQPGNAEILVEYAEALAQASNSLSGEPTKLLEQALKVDPANAKALTLAGGAAFEAGNYQKAIALWERLRAQVPPDSELGQALATGIERARAMVASGGKPAAPPPPAASGKPVRGEIALDPALKDRVRPDDTVFVFARAAQGPRMPLAVLRKQAKDLPLTFQLDDSMAMNPDLKLSAFPRIVVTARVSRAGSAMPQSGDLQGESKPVAPGADRVKVTIGSVVP